MYVRTEAGFSLIEILIASALFVVVAFAGLESLRVLLPAGRQLAARHLAYAGVEWLTAQLRAESRSAVALWPSAPPKTGARDDCDELTFYTADAAGPKFWTYRRFPNHTPADAVPPDALVRVTGNSEPPPCDPSATGQTVAGGVTAFTVTRLAAPQLAAHVDAYNGNNDGAFVAGTLDDDTVPMPVLDARGVPVQGGNAVEEVRLDTADASRVVDLVAGVAPGAFTTVLAYTCTVRCTVGHTAAGAQALTDCNATWSTASGWPVEIFAAGSWVGPGVYQPQGPPLGWAWDGVFSFNYSDGLNRSDPALLTRTYEMTNYPSSGWTTGGHMTAYGAFPSNLDATATSGAYAWFGILAADVASQPALAGSVGPVQAEFDKCQALHAALGSNAYLQN